MGMMAFTIQTVPRICTAGYERMVHDCDQTAFDQRQACSLWLPCFLVLQATHKEPMCLRISFYLSLEIQRRT